MGKFKLNTEPWYIAHIVLLVAVAFIGGHWLAGKICDSVNFCIEQGPTNIMLIKNLIYYSVLAYLFDTGFHSITGLD